MEMKGRWNGIIHKKLLQFAARDESLVMMASVDCERCASLFPGEIFNGKYGLNVD